VNNDCLEVDELILKLADYKNDYADMAAEKIFRKCSPVGRLVNTYKTAAGSKSTIKSSNLISQLSKLRLAE
jgi:hypothetical protein